VDLGGLFFLVFAGCFLAFLFFIFSFFSAVLLMIWRCFTAFFGGFFDF